LLNINKLINRQSVTGNAVTVVTVCRPPSWLVASSEFLIHSPCGESAPPLAAPTSLASLANDVGASTNAMAPGPLPG